jgi:hypothetical protein
MSIPERAASSQRDEEAQRIALLFDQLIPGDGAQWPAFSEAAEMAGFAGELDPSLQETARAWSDALSAMQPGERNSFLKEKERAEAATFAALLTAAHRAYYSAPAVLETVRRIADAAPREASALFDPTLVQNVMARGAGKRRM